MQYLRICIFYDQKNSWKQTQEKTLNMWLWCVQVNFRSWENGNTEAQVDVWQKLQLEQICEQVLDRKPKTFTGLKCNPFSLKSHLSNFNLHMFFFSKCPKSVIISWFCESTSSDPPRAFSVWVCRDLFFVMKAFISSCGECQCHLLLSLRHQRPKDTDRL